MKRTCIFHWKHSLQLCVRFQFAGLKTNLCSCGDFMLHSQNFKCEWYLNLLLSIIASPGSWKREKWIISVVETTLHVMLVFDEETWSSRWLAQGLHIALIAVAVTVELITIKQSVEHCETRGWLSICGLIKVVKLDQTPFFELAGSKPFTQAESLWLMIYCYYILQFSNRAINSVAFDIFLNLVETKSKAGVFSVKHAVGLNRISFYVKWSVVADLLWNIYN